MTLRVWESRRYTIRVYRLLFRFFKARKEHHFVVAPSKDSVPVMVKSVYAAVLDRVSSGVKSLETELAKSLPAEWVEEHGPRHKHMKDGMVRMHTAWQGIQEVLRARKGGFPQLEEALVEMAYTAAKLAMDARLAEEDNYRIETGETELDD